MLLCQYFLHTYVCWVGDLCVFMYFQKFSIYSNVTNCRILQLDTHIFEVVILKIVMCIDYIMADFEAL